LYAKLLSLLLVNTVQVKQSIALVLNSVLVSVKLQVHEKQNKQG